MYSFFVCFFLQFPASLLLSLRKRIHLVYKAEKLIGEYENRSVRTRRVEHSSPDRSRLTNPPVLTYFHSLFTWLGTSRMIGAGLGSSLGLDQCSSVLVKGGRRKFSLRVPFSIQQNSERTSKETITIPWEEGPSSVTIPFRGIRYRNTYKSSLIQTPENSPRHSYWI